MFTFFQEHKYMQLECSNMVSADSAMSNPGARADLTLSIPVRQVKSSLSHSFSGFTGESSAGDHQDCEVSPTLNMGEPPWRPLGPDGSCAGGSRDSALSRYKEKKRRK
jgi:hypothetical protein